MGVASQQTNGASIGVVLEPNAAARAAVTEAFESLGLRACVANSVAACVELIGDAEGPAAATPLARGDQVVAVVASFFEATEASPALLDLVKDRVFTPPIVVTVAPTLDRAAASLLGRSVWSMLFKPTTVAEAAAVVSAAIAEGHRRIADWRLVHDYRQRESRLSHVERQVLKAVCDGKLNKQIAREMNVSVRTIEQRRRRVFTAMDVSSAAPLAEQQATVQTLERVHASRRAAPHPSGGPHAAADADGHPSSANGPD